MKRLVKLFISVLVWCWDVSRKTVRRLWGRVPPATGVVLYYHGVAVAQRQKFARQMDQLLCVAQPVPAALPELSASGGCHCAVTFDDGFVSVVENALPELESRNIPATFFVPTGSLGGPPAWIKRQPSHKPTERVLSEEELKSLKDHPLLTIGSHSVSHPNLTRLDQARTTSELSDSKARLETVLGRAVTLFSFPHGAHNAGTLSLARAAGYERVFTIVPELNLMATNAFVVGRVAVEPDDWPLEFRLKVLGAYRWMASLPARSRRPSPRVETSEAKPIHATAA
jgi:peptidoglycan/xylan/chitin deacetylase (PgdA/CDA1 family)